MTDNNTKLIFELSKELGISFMDEEILDTLNKLLDSGINPDSLINLLEDTMREINEK